MITVLIHTLNPAILQYISKYIKVVKCSMYTLFSGERFVVINIYVNTHSIYIY